MTERRIDVDAYWREHGEAWRDGRRELAREDVIPRGYTMHITSSHPPKRSAFGLPDMREGNERLQRKRRTHGATD
jgi:hypothetical protein